MLRCSSALTLLLAAARAGDATVPGRAGVPLVQATISAYNKFGATPSVEFYVDLLYALSESK